MKPNDFICRAAMISIAGYLSANAAGPYAYTQPSWTVTSTLIGCTLQPFRPFLRSIH